MKIDNKFKTYVYRKWSSKYKTHMEHIFKLIELENIVYAVEFEIYYTTNHNHEFDYVNDLLSFKNYI